MKAFQKASKLLWNSFVMSIRIDEGSLYLLNASDIVQNDQLSRRIYHEYMLVWKWGKLYIAIIGGTGIIYMNTLKARPEKPIEQPRISFICEDQMQGSSVCALWYSLHDAHNAVLPHNNRWPVQEHN